MENTDEKYAIAFAIGPLRIDFADATLGFFFFLYYVFRKKGVKTLLHTQRASL